LRRNRQSTGIECVARGGNNRVTSARRT
jgi:hypothetical protein